MAKPLNEESSFRIKLLRNILIVSLSMVALLSLYNALFIYPSFTNLLVEATKDDAVKATRHLAALLISDQSELSERSFQREFLQEVETIKADFGLKKLHVYSHTGRSLFSTDPQEKKLFNTKPYFRDIVAKGKGFAQIVFKDAESLEGHKVTADVVETYIPLMRGNDFLGAFEIYYDITDRVNKLAHLRARSNYVLFTLTAILVFAIMVLFFMENRNAAARKRAETALRESEEKLAGILNAVTDLIVVVDRNLDIIWSNQKASAFFGPDLVGRRCCQDLNTRNRPRTSSYVESCFADGQSREHEAEILGVDGIHKNFWCTVNAATRADDGLPKTVIVVYRDVTEKKLLEAETARACQLASVGELAAGVAHEINNPINGIINCAQLLIDDGDLSRQQAEVSQRIRKAGGRIAMIVRNLLSFARDHKEDPEPVSIQRILSDTLDLTETQLRNDGIDLRVDFPDEIPLIRARDHQLQQVFLNIISNARYALNQKYTTAHEDKILEIRSTTVTDHGSQKVRLVFKDHGTGIAADIIDRICDPFYSTKPPGKGTGLGLSVSHELIKDHGGTLSFGSVEDEGTSVVIHLPVAETGAGDYTHDSNHRR